jgi:hypothetical protein
MEELSKTTKTRSQASRSAEKMFLNSFLCTMLREFCSVAFYFAHPV